jgi:sulfide:quinone oxidoreductase
MRSAPHFGTAITPRRAHAGHGLIEFLGPLAEPSDVAYAFSQLNYVKGVVAMTTGIQSPGAQFGVLIAGSGPAGIEAALTLQRVAGDRVVTTILTPEERALHLPMTVLWPFAAGHGEPPPLAWLASDARVSIRGGTVASVDADAREVVTDAGERIAYDALLLAVGGVQESPFPRALAFGLDGTDERMHGLIQDVEEGYVRRIAFVLAPGVSWPLPLYELALMLAERAFEMCMSVQLTFVTPEPTPLALFGEEASQSVAELLAQAGVRLISGVEAQLPECNVVELPEGRMEVDRVVTLPVIRGPAIAGIPHDDAGFIPVDQLGRVAAVPCVYAAGDAANFEIKQGGIACEQADAAAEAIAAEAGAEIEPVPFAPVLRGVLLTERESRWMQRDLSGATSDTGTVALPPLWWPPTKIAGRELSRHLPHVRVDPAFESAARDVAVDMQGSLR